MTLREGCGKVGVSTTFMHVGTKTPNLPQRERENMNPLDKDSLMTPALYMLLLTFPLIIFCKMKWGADADWFLYSWIGATFVVAFLWNNLYLWKE